MCMRVRSNALSYLFKNTMKNLLSVLLLSGACCLSAFADDIYFSTDFESGTPQGITLLDRDENPTKSGLGNIDLTAGTWTLNLVLEKDNHAMLSSAYCTHDYAIDDWMILPLINVKGSDAVLSWDAFSVHYDLREDYKVMISQAGNKPADFAEVYSVEEEEYFTRRHVISLAEYEGKDIYIAFVHTGKDKFLLGIDNIKVGEFTGDYALINRTDVSATGGEDIEICGAIRNLSSSAWYDPVLIVNGEEYNYYADQVEFPTPPTVWAVGEDVDFSFTVPTPEEGKLEYTIAVKSGDEIVWSESDVVYCSAFPHNILVEEFSATWCTGCPVGIVNMHKYEQRYRNRIIPVVGHSFPDVMYNITVHEGLSYWLMNLPGMVYDRRDSFKSQSAEDDGNIAKVMALPVTSQIVSSVRATADGKFEVTSTVRFSEEVDNAKGDYRVGYVITENVVHVDTKSYNQANNVQMVGNREYYFLPSAIPAQIAYFHDVARSTEESAFVGVENSLPAETLLPDVDYQVVDTIEIPTALNDPDDYKIDPRNISITTISLRSRSRIALNSYRVHADEFDWTESVEETLQEQSPVRITVVGDNMLVEGVEGRATVRLYGVDGRIIDTADGTSQVVVDTADYQGVAIAAIESAAGRIFRKVLIK